MPDVFEHLAIDDQLGKDLKFMTEDLPRGVIIAVGRQDHGAL